LIRGKILILKRMMSRFKLQENLIWVDQRKLILIPPKQKLLKVKGLLWNLNNDKFVNLVRNLPFSWNMEVKVCN